MIRIVLAAVMFATGAFGQAFSPAGSGLDSLRGWSAVGRINLNGEAFCSGALIGPRLVLTAAHCIYSDETGAQFQPEQITFLPGWRYGRALAYRTARRVLAHPEYQFNAPDWRTRLQYDIALIELDQPIWPSTVAPLETVEAPRMGDHVILVSYMRDQPDVAAVEDGCRMIARQGSAVVFSCAADFGSSGAPVLLRLDPQDADSPVGIGAVISSIASWNGQRVAVGTTLGVPLQTLIGLLDEDDPVLRTRRAGEASIASQLGRE